MSAGGRRRAASPLPVETGAEAEGGTWAWGQPGPSGASPTPAAEHAAASSIRRLSLEDELQMNGACAAAACSSSISASSLPNAQANKW